MRLVRVRVRYRSGAAEVLVMSAAEAGAFHANPPASVETMSIEGGIDDFVLSHVPLGPPAWAERGRDLAEFN